MPTPDKCASHDACFQRLYGKIEAMDEKLDRLMAGFRDRLHDGDLRLKELDLRLARCEAELAAAAANRTAAGRKLFGSAVDLLKAGVVAAAGAAAWAVAAGYGG